MLGVTDSEPDRMSNSDSGPHSADDHYALQYISISCSVRCACAGSVGHYQWDGLMFETFSCVGMGDPVNPWLCGIYRWKFNQ
jgi:hypothetical protein